jgi:hypothetical protein
MTENVKHVETLRAMRSVFENIPAPCDERAALDAALAALQREAAGGGEGVDRWDIYIDDGYDPPRMAVYKDANGGWVKFEDISASRGVVPPAMWTPDDLVILREAVECLRDKSNEYIEEFKHSKSRRGLVGGERATVENAERLLELIDATTFTAPRPTGTDKVGRLSELWEQAANVTVGADDASETQRSILQMCADHLRTALTTPASAEPGYGRNDPLPVSYGTDGTPMLHADSDAVLRAAIGSEARGGGEAVPVAWLWLQHGTPVNAFIHKPGDCDEYWIAKGYTTEPLYRSHPTPAALDAEDAARYREIARRFDHSKTSASERFLEALGIDGNPLKRLDILIDAARASTGAES